MKTWRNIRRIIRALNERVSSRPNIRRKIFSLSPLPLTLPLPFPSLVSFFSSFLAQSCPLPTYVFPPPRTSSALSLPFLVYSLFDLHKLRPPSFAFPPLPLPRLALFPRPARPSFIHPFMPTKLCFFLSDSAQLPCAVSLPRPLSGAWGKARPSPSHRFARFPPAFFCTLLLSWPRWPHGPYPLRSRTPLEYFRSTPRRPRPRLPALPAPGSARSSTCFDSAVLVPSAIVHPFIPPAPFFRANSLSTSARLGPDELALAWPGLRVCSRGVGRRALCRGLGFWPFLVPGWARLSGPTVEYLCLGSDCGAGGPRVN
ncbi:hypothetical protein Mapa_014438 [Marchantia paleacea]|nr:hypothetical protein Mapa_014438 [Marchantia paleacea]